VLGFERIRVRGPTARGTWKTIDILACPVTWRPHPEQIAAARRGYEDWWQALDWVRDGLVAGRMLREVEVATTMQKGAPVEPKKMKAPSTLRSRHASRRVHALDECYLSGHGGGLGFGPSATPTSTMSSVLLP